MRCLCRCGYRSHCSFARSCSDNYQCRKTGNVNAQDQACDYRADTIFRLIWVLLCTQLPEWFFRPEDILPVVLESSLPLRGRLAQDIIPFDLNEWGPDRRHYLWLLATGLVSGSTLPPWQTCITEYWRREGNHKREWF
jgi:hypothetical protein